MLNFLRFLFGKNPNESQVKCSACGHSDTFRKFGTWEEGGERGLRGKLPSGHIVVACPKCKKELKYDSLSGKLEILEVGNEN